jgi:hypothetical protein
VPDTWHLARLWLKEEDTSDKGDRQCLIMIYKKE